MRCFSSDGKLSPMMSVLASNNYRSKTAGILTLFSGIPASAEGVDHDNHVVAFCSAR